jgi:hypothetical protein
LPCRKVDSSLGFLEAVDALIGSLVTMEPTQGRGASRKTRLIFPPEADRDGGREYLLSVRQVRVEAEKVNRAYDYLYFYI